jgi:hypothetical protein
LGRLELGASQPVQVADALIRLPADVDRRMDGQHPA